MKLEKNNFDAIIIGAGFSGLYQLYCLRDRLGLSAKIFESAVGVGGTWYFNRYPGARCDSESHSYSYYFSDQLLQEWEWTERYPQQPEVLRYLNFVAEKLNLLKDISFDTRIAAASYDTKKNLWTVQTVQGETFQATFLITAVGCLSSTNIPDIPGLEGFKGNWYHTGEWPHEGVDFSGKKVGLIGTGSTGIQATPIIAEQAEKLTIFQRTPNFSVPAHNGPLSEEFKRYVKKNTSEIRELMHKSTNGHPFLIDDRSVLETPPEERQALFEKAWKVGGLRFRAIFKDLLFDKDANEMAVEFIRSKIKKIVRDPKTAEKLTNFDHPFAAKRPPIDTNYFETFNRENVELVDVRANPIQRITQYGIKTEIGEFELDAIVFATGFDAMTGALLGINITGRDGIVLKDAWKEGPKTYLGLQIKGFPNLFTITGPGSPSVLCNMPVAIEQHVEWITDFIAYMRSNGLSKIETTSAATESWVKHVNQTANETLLPQATHSWYLGANVPGKPRVFMPYVGGMARYREHCANVAKNNYEGFVLSS